ncbi:hypothetical protein PEL8287_02238 [Roseovarius litorisediminis]|uniref:Uncharacterized protein n=1 Tax=Roseovarius litorisediminis TaxID=1312363 RepID=A0A1Y5SMI9_9RHOB|nr:hypothetical protein PEL8287_02238 [Roseovarius litorisediminis]
MNRLRITSLRRRYGLSETRARLVAELFFGGAKNG